MKRIGLLTSGGDCQGLNAALRGVAKALYEKFGFSTIGMRKKYYQDNNEDALIMFTENIWYDKFKSNYKKLKEEFYGQT